MAHHQRTNHQRIPTAQGISSSTFHGSAGAVTTGDDELASDVDEPPDQRIQFAKLKPATTLDCHSSIGRDCITSTHTSRDRKESLLTQALLSSPELYPLSETDGPVPPSDGGLTSPARTSSPSPPLLTAHASLAIASSKDSQFIGEKQISSAVQIAPALVDTSSHELSVEAGLGRKRCISFACGRQSASQNRSEPLAKAQATAENALKASSPPKRPCMLKFVCPTKPFRVDSLVGEKRGESPSPAEQKPRLEEGDKTGPPPASKTSGRPHRESDSTIKRSPGKILAPPAAMQNRKGRVFNRIDFQKSEATRFHEFACDYNAEDEWTNEQTAYRQKITVNDTLRKENAIRRLAEEAEEEALDDEVGEDIFDDDEDNRSSYEDETIFDDGNETDDEEGFADSDEETDDGSDYHFWTPGLTTAATSTEHLEHIRPIAHRVASVSSIESTASAKKMNTDASSKDFPVRTPRMRSGTPTLPDSSDFVVGTVDEDRPLEEAYLSCLEERRRSKHKLIPQDIDPSFPTSGSEADGDEHGDGHEGAEKVESGGKDIFDINNAPKSADEFSETLPHAGSLSRCQRLTPTRSTRLSAFSPPRTQYPTPKRLQSPTSKRNWSHRSPPPRRLFGQCIGRIRSPPPMHRKVCSPPSSRRTSFEGSLEGTRSGIEMPHLAQRPNLTHTTSLPRTPNPFWSQHRRSYLESTDTLSAGTSPKSMKRQGIDVHSRGPIDIVQGLETKRQKRKDRFWRQHCRSVGKEKYRRCQPGKGAERMKELGLEMADRFRGYGQKAQLILSV